MFALINYFEQRFLRREGVNHQDILGSAFQIERTINTRELIGIFKLDAWHILKYQRDQWELSIRTRRKNGRKLDGESSFVGHGTALRFVFRRSRKLLWKMNTAKLRNIIDVFFMGQ